MCNCRSMRNSRRNLPRPTLDHPAGDALSKREAQLNPRFDIMALDATGVAERAIQLYGSAMLWRLLTIVMCISACSSSQTKRRVDGTYAISCRTQKACLDHAAKICGETGYNIVGGRHDQKVYGVPGNEKVVGKDEIYIRCAKDKLEDAPDPAAGSWKLERKDAGLAVTNLETSRQARVCRPGETQRCIGAGACEGGQACKTDGNGFGPCDCGAENGNHTPDASVESR